MMRRIPVVIAWLVCLFLLVPIFIVIPMSFSTAVSFKFPPPGYSLQYYYAYFSSAEWLSATANSVLIGFAVMVATLLLVIPAAFGYVRYRFAGRAAVNLLLMTPLIVPHVVTALGDYGLLSRLGLVGTHVGMVLAHTVLSVPVAFLAIAAALKGFDRNLERAAMMCGAGPLRTFWHVTMPVLRPGLAVGAFFAFMQSFNEAVVAIFIAGRQANTLPKKMFESVRLDSDPVLAVASTLLVGAALVGAIFMMRGKENVRG